METTLIINNVFSLRTAKEHTMQWGSRSFAKETRVLKMRSTVASHQKLTMTNWEQSWKLILLQLHKKLLKWILYNNRHQTTSVAGPRRSFKTFPKAKLAPKKVHGHCLVVCCWSDPLERSQSQGNHYIWEVCSVNQWDAPKTTPPVASISQQKEPDFSPWQHLTTGRTTNSQKLNELGYEVLPHRPHSLDLSPTTYHFFKHLDNFFAGKMLPKPAEGRKCFPRVHWILKHSFYATGINKHWQKCVDCNGSYLD